MSRIVTRETNYFKLNGFRQEEETDLAGTLLRRDGDVCAVGSAFCSARTTYATAGMVARGCNSRRCCESTSCSIGMCCRVRAGVEDVLRAIKRQISFMKVLYKEMANYAAQVLKVGCLNTLYMSRRDFMSCSKVSARCTMRRVLRVK